MRTRRKPKVTPNKQEPIRFKLTDDHVTLGQILKLCGVIGSGGEAKMFLPGSGVTVNGEIDERRGRKLRIGDRVLSPGFRLILIVAPESDASEGQNGTVRLTDTEV